MGGIKLAGNVLRVSPFYVYISLSSSHRKWYVCNGQWQPTDGEEEGVSTSGQNMIRTYM